jgi:hypothetical protein
LLSQQELYFLEGHDGDEQNAKKMLQQSQQKWWWFLLYALSDSKIKLIMLKNNTNNLSENLTKQNINCHSQCDDQIHYYYIMSTSTKNPSQGRHIRRHQTNEL